MPAHPALPCLSPPVDRHRLVGRSGAAPAAGALCLPRTSSGRNAEQDGISHIWVLLLGGLGISYGLDLWAGHEQPIMLYLAIFGSFISYIYSAPPLKLKQSGWAGNYALGSSYIALPWWAGQVRDGHGVV